MQIFTKKDPFSEIENFEYYYPESLTGQKNGVGGLIQPGVHQNIHRPDGTVTCSCGLVLHGSFSYVGHRNHETGEQELQFVRVEDPKFGANKMTYNCALCLSAGDHTSDFVTAKNVDGFLQLGHDCPLQPYFETLTSRFDRAFSFLPWSPIYFSLPSASDLFEKLGYVTLDVTPFGARFKSTADNFEPHLKELLSRSDILVSSPESSFDRFDAWNYGSQWDDNFDKEESGEPKAWLLSPESAGIMTARLKWTSRLPAKSEKHKYRITKNHFMVVGGLSDMTICQVPIIGLN
jgi:hypothetical protein